MKLCICLIIALSLALSITAMAAGPVPHYQVIRKIPVGGDGGWDCLTFDSGSRRLYIARSNRVTVVNMDQGVVVGEVANTQGVHGVALVPKLHRGFASAGGDNSVVVFDLATLKETARVKVGARPDVIIYDPVTDRIFTFNAGSMDTTAVDASSMKVVGSIDLGGKPEFAVTDGSGKVFVNIEDKSEIVEFDSRALTVKHRWSIAPGEEPSGLAMDHKHRILLAACSNEKMAVVSADTGRVIATPAIGKGPDGAEFDQKLGIAFSPNGQDGTLTLVKEVTLTEFKVAETVTTERGARTMALDPKTHEVFLATASFGPATEVNGRRRPTILPNSFAILVVGIAK